MEFVEHSISLYDLLSAPGCMDDGRGRLDPIIDEGMLEELYGEVARILLRLSQPRLNRIGSLEQTDDFIWELNRRPLSQAMNEWEGD